MCLRPVCPIDLDASCGSSRERKPTPGTCWPMSTIGSTEGFDTKDLREAKALLEGLIGLIGKLNHYRFSTMFSGPLSSR
jgi:hypothetical protein